MTERIQDILDDCLERILTGDESIDSCLDRHPGMRDELEPLLRLSLESQAALRVAVPVEAKAAGRERLMSAAAAAAARWPSDATAVRKAGSRRKPFLRLPRLMLKPVLLGAMLTALLFGGTAMAASGAEPDSFLYPVKLSLEDLRTVIAFQPLDQARVEAGHADARLDEIMIMVDEDKADYVPGLFEAYNEEIGEADADMLAAAAAGKDTADVEEMLADVRDRHDRILLAIEDDVPDDVRAAIADDIEEAADRDSGATGNPAGDEGAADARSPGENMDDGNGGDSYRQPGHEGGGTGDDADHAPGDREDGQDHDSNAPAPGDRDNDDMSAVGGDGGDAADTDDDEDMYQEEGVRMEGSPGNGTTDNPSSF